MNKLFESLTEIYKKLVEKEIALNWGWGLKWTILEIFFKSN